ncbi:pyrimidine/purine nucleoside phosphorylase [Pedobacter sp.]|uniref:pyrimidine/purine nucleoside phosphorylase n=1 Tax=Pedobacter sp. TaxID=1411316 RepID=UPI002C586122|nr:pyrimidine/purine nucleoside phosphorylase [Pedobacter sp.]HWW42494.1 pyrimidine/purine nucleoside phosphorylase [Pedobacter sp.]
MSNTDNLLPHYTYFDGKVQSLGLETEHGKATVGVMKAGTYEFSTSSHEKMVVITGILKVKTPNEDWIEYKAQEEFEIAAGNKFEVNCDADTSYICYYG